MVDRAQRLWLASRSDRHHRVPTRFRFRVDQPFERTRRNSRHIARDHQVPVVFRCAQRREYAAQRPASGHAISTNSMPKLTVSIGIADNNYRTDCVDHSSRNMFNQRRFPISQQCLIPAHSGAGAARQHIPGPPHERIIALRSRVSWRKQRFAMGRIPGIIG